MSDPLQGETQDSLACLSSAAQLSSVRPQPTVDGCAAPTPQRASDEPLFFSPDTAGDPQHVAAAAPTEVERRTSESPSSASTGSLVDFLISDDDDAPNDGTQGSGAAPSPQQQRPPAVVPGADAAAAAGAAVPPPREPASALHNVLQQIRTDTGDGLGSDDDDHDIGRQNPLAPLPASVAAPVPRPGAPSAAAVPAVPAVEAQRQSSTFAGSMPTGQVHQVFRSHWSRQDDERKAFRFAIDAALTPAQLRRKHRLINADNWVPPGIETDVRGQRIGVIMPPSSAAPAAPAEDEGFANVPEQHPDDVLLPDVLVPASNADGTIAPPPDASRPTLRSHQIDGIRFLWDRLIDLPRDPATGQPQAQTAGCILAHSMGLGKTCQVLSFIFLFHRHANPNARVLLFVPKSTIVSWGTEINKWQGYYYPSARGMSVQSSTRVGLRPPRLHVFDDAMKRDQRLSKLKQLQLGLDVDDSAAQEAAAGIYILSYEGAATLTMRTAGNHSGGGDSLAPAANSGPEVVDAASIHCDLIVCDEAHRLKSDKRVDTRMIRAMNTRRRLLLTGTPLQNHLTEYYCMINVAMPNFFPRKMFREFFARPIARSMTKHADQRTIDHARQRTFTLIREVDPFVQRRDANVLTRELPRLLEFVVVVKLSPMQSRLYDELLAIMRKQGKKVNLLQGFSYAAKLCAHPQILFSAYSRLSLAALAARGTTSTTTSAAVPITLDDDGTGAVPLTLGSDSEEDEITDDESPAKTAQGNKKRSRMAIAAGGGGPERATTTSKVAPAKSTDEATHTRLARLCEPPRGYEPKSDDSAKMQLALELMRHCVINLKEKVLLFSMSTVLLDFVQDLLDHASAVPGHAALGGYLRIDGSSSSATRKEQIEAFQNPDEELRVDPEAQRKHSVFLLSTKAGGVGLTLTAATRIIILDCSWNPADDRQAIGRAYRYGQTRPVFVYRLVCSGTIEHRVFDQKVAKEWLFQTVVDSEVVKRDNLKGAKLQNFLFRRDDEDSGSTIKPDAVRDTERCCRADPVLGAMRGHVLSATTHNTMLEEDEAEYGAAEEQFYAEYKKRGGFLANAGEAADTPTNTSVVARQRQTERALEQQSASLAQVLQTMINRRAEDAIRNGALNQAQVAAAAASPTPTPTAAGSGTNPAGGAPRHNFSMALAQLLDANAPRRSGAPGAGLLPTTSRYASSVRLHNQPPLPPAPVVGPGSSRDDALSIDDDEGGTAPSPARAQRPPQPASAAAADDDDDDDVIVVD